MAITVTCTSGGSQLVPANIGQNSKNIIIQVLNGGAPVVGATVSITCVKLGYGAITPPVGYPGATVTDASGNLTLQVIPPTMTAADPKTFEFDFTATYSSASGTFSTITYYVSGTEVPGIYTFIASPPSAQLSPYKAQAGVAGTPIKIQVFNALGAGVANVGCKLVAQNDGGGGTQQVITCAEATGPEGLVLTNAFGFALMTPTFASANSALGGYPGAAETFTINMGQFNTFGPFDFLITTTAPAVPPILPTAPGLLDRTGWVVTVDSIAGAGYEGPLAIDGNGTTFWNSLGGASGYPHFISVDMGSPQYIDGIQCWPRQDGFAGNSAPADVQAFVSSDGVNWGTAVGSFSWGASANLQLITFPGVTKRYFKLVGVNGAGGATQMGCSELNAGSGFVPQNGGHGAITLATLSMTAWTSYNTNGYANAGLESVQFTSDLAQSQSSLTMPTADHPLQSTTWTQPVDNFRVYDLATLVVSFFPYTSLLEDPVDSVMRVYACIVHMTFADGWTGYAVPTAVSESFYAGNNTIGLPNSEIYGSQYAIDIDSTPPSTYAQLTTRRFSPVGDQTAIHLSKWVPYGAALPYPGQGVQPGYTGNCPATGTFGNVAY